MSRRRGLSGLTVLLTALAAALLGIGPVTGSADAAAQAPGRITGTVTGPGGVPLEGAFVSAYPVRCPNGCDGYAATSGADGSYELENVAPGAYILLFQKGFDYVAEYYDNVVENENATHVKVTAGSTVTGKDAQLELGGHLTGTVTGRGSRPLKDISVRAYVREGGTWQYVGDDQTASNGDYDIGNGLLGGVYRLCFVDDREPGYVSECYRGAATLQTATNVVMEENETVDGLDVRLAWPVHLRMVEPPKIIGKPRPGALLRLFPGKWAPAKVSVLVYGWYADDLYHYLGSHHPTLRLAGKALALARGHYVKVRFTVTARGYFTIDRTLTLKGGPVPR